MIKRYFSLPELLVLIAIISILAAMLFPVLYKAREKARMYDSYERYYKEHPTELKLRKFTWEFLCKENYIDRSDIKHPKMLKVEKSIISNKPDYTMDYMKNILDDLERCKYFDENPTTETSVPDSSLYDNWVQFTGNPKFLTKQQFDALYEEDAINEYKWEQYQILTGNPQNLTREEFDVLKKSKQIKLFKKEVKQPTTTNW